LWVMIFLEICRKIIITLLRKYSRLFWHITE
jgi:hypothetical protein